MILRLAKVSPEMLSVLLNWSDWAESYTGELATQIKGLLNIYLASERSS